MARQPETRMLNDLVIRGETHLIREELKRHGFLWDNERREWRSGWTHDGFTWEYEFPNRTPDGPVAEEFVKRLKTNRRGLNLEIGYYTAY